MIKKKKKLHKVALIGLLIALEMAFWGAGGNLYAENDYHFLSKDFSDAVGKIKADSFFLPISPPSPNLPTYKGVDLDEQIKVQREVSPTKKHYEKIGENLCAPIVESYAQMMGKGIEGKDIYSFDEELTKRMRQQGAYVLPLRFFPKDSSPGNPSPPLLEAEYFNPLWEKVDYEKKFRDLYYSSVAPYERVWHFQFKEKGVLDLLVGDMEYVNFRKFDNAAAGGGFQVKKFNTSFRFMRSYLFVFLKDANDLNKEWIFYYVDLPFGVTGQKYGELEKLEFKQDALTKVSCHILSKSFLYLYATSSPKRFVEEKRSIAGISDVEPLTIPVRQEYGRTRMPRKDGKSGLEKIGGYDILADEISEPSLRCWMIAFGFDKSDFSQCRNTGYAQEYMRMLNSNICIWNDRITKAPEVKYPYNARAGYQIPNYSNGVIGFKNRCSPLPYKAINGDAK